MVDAEAKDCESTHQLPRKKAGGIPPSTLKEWEGFVSDPILGLMARLSEWSFRVAVASGLSWDDLLCTAPATIVLIKDGPIGFAAQNRNQWKV